MFSADTQVHRISLHTNKCSPAGPMLFSGGSYERQMGSARTGWDRFGRCAAHHLIDWYQARWEIEPYFNVLKNGRKVEALQLSKMDWVERALLVSMIVAWRIARLMRLDRTCPDLDASLPCMLLISFASVWRRLVTGKVGSDGGYVIRSVHRANQHSFRQSSCGLLPSRCSTPVRRVACAG